MVYVNLNLLKKIVSQECIISETNNEQGKLKGKQGLLTFKETLVSS